MALIELSLAPRQAPGAGASARATFPLPDYTARAMLPGAARHIDLVDVVAMAFGAKGGNGGGTTISGGDLFPEVDPDLLRED